NILHGGREGPPTLPRGLDGLDELVDPAQADHQRGPGRQHVAAVEFVDLAGPDGCDAIPAWTGSDGRDLDGLAAPRGEDDLGIPPDHLVRLDAPSLRGRLIAQLGED